mmetsp:Transcript_40364/g.103352  ORF Transcript_40364/g.103352 Transcript_40364/m.103352 type:complete len:205 (-) Transcript_40364:451-1065(-)
MVQRAALEGTQVASKEVAEWRQGRGLDSLQVKRHHQGECKTVEGAAAGVVDAVRLGPLLHQHSELHKARVDGGQIAQHLGLESGATVADAQVAGDAGGRVHKLYDGDPGAADDLHIPAGYPVLLQDLDDLGEQHGADLLAPLAQLRCGWKLRRLGVRHPLTLQGDVQIATGVVDAGGEGAVRLNVDSRLPQLCLQCCANAVQDG